MKASRLLATLASHLAVLFAASSLQAQAPNISVTKSDGTPAATKKNPGDTVTYTNTITNSGPGPATGVAFTDPDMAGAAVQNGTLKVSPIAFDDSYTSVVASGVTINTNTATEFSVTANDFVGVFNNNPGVLTIASFDATSANGGTVTMITSGADMGKFTYVSAAGYVGPDSFTYTISNTGFTATGTVSLTVSGPGMFFVSTTGNDTTGNGTLAAPFATLTKVATVDVNTSQRIFLFTGAYTAGMTMEANEQIIGQGVVGASFDAAILGITPGVDSAARPTIGGVKPTITAGAGNVITLASDNVIRGVTINSTAAGFAVAGTSITNFQLGSTAAGAAAADTAVNSSSSSLGCLSLTGAATGTVNVLAQLTATVGRSVLISDRTGGTTSVIGKVTDNGTGVALSSNTGATFNFRCLVLSTLANTAFSATGGGTLNATNGVSDAIDNDGDGTTDEADEANTLTTTTATALNVSSTTIGASNLTFRSISSNGGSATGIILSNTGSSGGLRVVGDGSAGSGGTIANKTGTDSLPSTGTGIYLSSTAGVQLDRMILQNFGNHAIRGLSVAGFTLANSTINTTSGKNGTSNAFDEGSVIFGVRAGTTGLTGTATITNTTITNGFEDTVGIYNASGTLTLTMDNTPINGAGNDGIAVELHSTATATVEVKNSAISANMGDHFQATASGSAVLNVLFGTNGANTLTGGAPGALGQSLVIQTGGQWSGTGTFNIANNSINGAVDTPININAGGTGNLVGTITNNTIGTSGVDNTGTINNEDCIRIVASGDKGALGANAHGGTLTVAITNNTLQQLDAAGIFVMGRDGGSVSDPIELNITIQGNLLRQPTPADPVNSFSNAIRLESGASSSPTPDNVRLHANIGGAGALANVIQGDFGPAGGDEIRIRHQFSASCNFFLSGLAADTNNTPTVVNYLTARNTIDSGRIISATISGGGTYKTAGAAPLPLLFAPAEMASFGLGTPESVESAIALTETVRIQSADRGQSAVGSEQSAAVATPALTQAQLEILVAAARERWVTTGLSAEQRALLEKVSFEVADLPGWHLGAAAGASIQVDRDAGGNGWFIDATPEDDSEFDRTSLKLVAQANELKTPSTVDLLTTVMHEMGHALGLSDSYNLRDRNSIMYGHLTTGERRYPSKDQARGAAPFKGDASHFLTGAVNIFTLPPGKSVTITYDVIVNTPATTTTLSSQATVTGGNFARVFSDDLVTLGDPLLPGAADSTVTLIEAPSAVPEIAVTETVAGDIPANTGTFSFGSTTVGSPVTKTFTVTNSGSAALTLSNLTPPSGFAIAQNFGSTTVAASGGQTTFQIVMSAGAPSSPSGTLTFDTNDSDENPFNFTISGTVIAAPDTTPPVISGTPANITGVEATSPAGAVVTFSSPTALDAVDGVRPVTCVPPSGSTFAFGTTTVVCSASDTSGNSASSSFTVTVLDTLPPVISGTPSNITGVAASSPSGAVVTYTNPTATDVVDGVVTVSCVPPSGSTFPVGVTTVVCSATDSHMNGTSSSFTITVLPPAPEIAVSGNGNNIADGSNLAAASTTNATDFGSTPVQGGLVEVTYTITNSGPGVLNLSGGPNFVSVTPSTDFSVTQQPAATVADSGGTTTFKIAFNPTTAATTSATVTFGSDDADEGSFDFVIKGTGTPAQTFDLAGNAVANTPFDGGETYIYGSGPPPVSPLPLESPAVLGAQAPGLDPGIVFSYFGDISLNNDGDAVVYARVSGAGISAANDGSVWVLDENGFNLLIREGDAMPVGAGTVAEPLSSVRMTNTGVSHFMSGVAGTGVTTATNAAGWVDDGTSVTPFYLKGTTFSNVFNGVSQQTNTNDGYFAGQLKLESGSVTAANDTGVWKTEADGTVTPAVREGAVIAGAVKVGNLMNRVAVGSNGMGVYPAYLTGVTPAATNRAVLKQDFYNGGAPVIVVQSQIAGSVPGVAGGLFSTFSSESVNASGKVAIGAMLVTGAAGGGVTSAEDTGIWREDASGNLELVIREGEQVTGRDPGVVYAIFSEHWLLDDGGMVVQATLRGSGVTGSNNSGLWHIDAAGTKTLLVGTGETVAEIGGAQVSAFNLRPDVSAAGKYAVTVKLTTGVAGTVLGTNLVLLAGDVTTPGTFSLKLRSGDAYSVGGTARQIRNMFLGHVSGNHSTTTGGTGGMSRAVNDAGQVAVWLEFTDGTKGMFVGP